MLSLILVCLAGLVYCEFRIATFGISTGEWVWTRYGWIQTNCPIGPILVFRSVKEVKILTSRLTIIHISRHMVMPPYQLEFWTLQGKTDSPYELGLPITLPDGEFRLYRTVRRAIGYTKILDKTLTTWPDN